MDNLPDDVLLMVMSHLDMADLFRCRLVFKRLATLALHPELWRGKGLIEPFTPAPDYSNPIICPVLRLAPCLDMISISLPSDHVCHLLFSAPCAVKKLDIIILEGNGAAHAGLLIRHQRELGRLREVELYFETDDIFGRYISRVDVAVLFGALVSTPDLSHLKIWSGGIERIPDESVPRSVHLTVAASLTNLDCPLNPSLEHFYYCLLAGHAATLKQVELSIGCSLDSWHESLKSPTMAAQLLSQMPHLSKLVCPILPGMEALAECTSLRFVHLEVYSDSEFPRDAARAAAAANFLRRACQLRTVELNYDGDLDVELITALASSGRSCVELLFVRFDNTDKVFDELLRALPSLPALRTLDVNITGMDISRAQKLLAKTISLKVEQDVEIR